mgnify:CR=1 FL=1
MNIRPVSFGSLMVFTIKDNKPKMDVPSLVGLSFNNNDKLKGYSLEKRTISPEIIDGSVHNAAKDYARTLDERYRNELEKEPKKVKFTEVTFSVNPRTTEKRYFLTAATNGDEARIHDILSRGSNFYIARF